MTETEFRDKASRGGMNIRKLFHVVTEHMEAHAILTGRYRNEFMQPLKNGVADTQLGKAAEAARDRIAQLEAATKAFLETIDKVHASQEYQSVWLLSQIHNGEYTGPSYSDALWELRKALANDAQRKADSPKSD